MQKTVQEIIDMINNKELFYDQTTQRQFIYANLTVNTDHGEITKAGNVVRSILHEKIQLPALFFWKRDDGKYNIHDGKQRILSLYYFCNPRNAENISVTTRLETECTFTNLSKDRQNELLNYKFDIVLKEGPKELEEKSFDLINTNGVPLTDYECIRGLSYGKWFKGFEDFISAQGQILDEVPKQIGRGVEALHFLLAYFSLLNDKLWKNKIRNQLNISRNYVFDPNTNNYYNKIQLFNDIANASKCSTQICLQIADYIIKKNWNPEPVIKYYRDGSKEENDFKKWQIDTHMIAIENLIIKNTYCDYKRNFDKKDKSSLYKLKQKCNIPGCDISDYDKLAVDHITAWSKGGKTVLKNAQLLCKNHNSSKGKDSYAEWTKNNGDINNTFKENNFDNQFSIIDAWSKFENSARKINQFKNEYVKGNTRINIERITDVSEKLGFTELDVDLLHKIRRERNDLVHPRDGSIVLSGRKLNQDENKQFNKILNAMDDYIKKNNL